MLFLTVLFTCQNLNKWRQQILGYCCLVRPLYIQHYGASRAKSTFVDCTTYSAYRSTQENQFLFKRETIRPPIYCLGFFKGSGTESKQEQLIYWRTGDEKGERAGISGKVETSLSYTFPWSPVHPVRVLCLSRSLCGGESIRHSRNYGQTGYVYPNGPRRHRNKYKF